MSVFSWRAPVVACVFLSWAGATLPAMDLVQDRQPKTVIVVAHPPEPGAIKRTRKTTQENDETTAARVLVDWIEKITGVALPVTNSASPTQPAIFVGRAAVAAGLNLGSIESASREGLRIRVEAQRVLLAGQSDAATLKAACRFLEALGCRYFMDGPLGEVYPRQSSLSVEPLEITEKPGLAGRNPKGPSWDARLWKAWNGAGGELLQHQHAWGRYVNESAFAEHPRFFAMGRDGKRHPGQWLCTSNKELRAYVASQVILAIERGVRNPSLSPTDGRGYCQCPECKAQDDPRVLEPSSGTVSVSARYVDFFDDVARRVAKVHPESILSFYCYADYTQPPALNRKLSSNLCAVIAPIRYCRLHAIGDPHCPSRAQQVSLIEGWAALASHLGYYNYMYNLADGTLPCFKFTPFQKEFPYLASKGLRMMTLEVLSNWHVYGPQIYLSLRLAYDPQADASAIMEDYWQKFYGTNAAPYMKQYWMGIDAQTTRLDTHAGGFAGLAQLYTPEFLKECERWLAQAAQAAASEPQCRERVALHTEGFRSALEYRQLSDAMARGDLAAALRIYNAMVSRLEGLAANGWANREYGTAYLKRFVRPEVQAGAEATAPPNRLLQVIPGPWRFRCDESNRGLEQGWQQAQFEDREWSKVVTQGRTLDAQRFDKNTILWYRTAFVTHAGSAGLALWFGDVDGLADVYVNGKKLEPKVSGQFSPSKKTSTSAADPRPRQRVPFEVDITDAVHAGTNSLALRIDHTQITDLSLGGILGPVLLLQKGQ